MTSSINYLGTTLGLIALATLLSQVDAGRAKIKPDQISVSSTAQAETPNKPYWDSFDVLKICNSGTEQSPIDIKEQFTEPGPSETFSYDIYDTPLDFVMKNDGNTVKAYLKDNKDIPSIIFAGYQYKFSHFLFHWGGDNTVGSEHLLDGIAAPLEVQLVHFNSMNAKTFEEALAKKETILVLGALFDIIPCSVTAFEPLINTLEDVVSPGSEAEVTGLKLEDLLPTDKNTFFAYLGSLTMPRCEEGVEWFVFKQKSYISQEQLEKFRGLKNSQGTPMTNNYRSVSKLNDRTVYKFSK